MTRFNLHLLIGLLLVLHPGASSQKLAGKSEAPKPAAAVEATTAKVAASAPVRKAGARADDAARVLRRINPELSAQQALKIGEAVVRHGARYGLDLELVLAVILVESGARPSVVSPAGALGLMQVMPAHFEHLGMPGDGTQVERNVQAGCSILARNIARHGEERGILAYYWGEQIRGDAYLGKVRAAQAKVRERLSS